MVWGTSLQTEFEICFFLLSLWTWGTFSRAGKQHPAHKAVGCGGDVSLLIVQQGSLLPRAESVFVPPPWKLLIPLFLYPGLLWTVQPPRGRAGPGGPCLQPSKCSWSLVFCSVAGPFVFIAYHSCRGALKSCHCSMDVSGSPPSSHI